MVLWPTVYLLAPLGTSPAVLTETLWYLTVSEGHQVLGVEVWVTDALDGTPRTSLNALRQRVEAGLWDRLVGAVGPHAARLPPLPRRFEAYSPAPERPVAPGLVVYRFERDGRPLPDVRDAVDAVAVAEQLHARVRSLCAQLGSTVLIGSVAGGRKNFGASLQGAFELQARPTDRLVHVLLHENIENDAELFRGYVAPEQPVAGVPVDEQLTVFDVPFPPLRHLLPETEWESALDREDAIALWSQLRANAGAAGQHVARLVSGTERQWRLVIEHRGQEVHSVALTAGSAEMYAALVRVRESAERRWEAWSADIFDHPRGRISDFPKAPNEDAVRRRLSELRQFTEELRRVGLGPFALHGEGVDAHIPARERVELS